jgi:type 1 glutamine amidotransferase
MIYNTCSIPKMLRNAIVFFLLCCSLLAGAQRMPRALLITGNGNLPVAQENQPPWVHQFHNAKVIEILKDVVLIDTTEALSMLNATALQRYDLVISNSLFLKPTAAQMDALMKFVSSGKSFLTLHCGILTFLNSPHYEKLIGALFIGGPATVPETVRVVTENSEFWGYEYPFRKNVRHPVSRVTSDFTTTDEVYFIEPLTSEFYVIARAENHAVMWWHPVGNGRAMSLTLGHSLEAKNNTGYQDLLRNGVRWLMGYPLVADVNIKPLSTRQAVYKNLLRLPDLVGNETNISYRLAADNPIDIIRSTLSAGSEVDVTLTGPSGASSISVLVANDKKLVNRKDFVIKVIADGDGNIASYHGNMATSSSSDNNAQTADANNAIDGDPTTMWSSAFVDQASLVIDLQKDYTIGKIVLQWYDAFAEHYQVQVSGNNRDWLTVADVKNGDGKQDTVTFSGTHGRYIKITGIKRGQPRYGYALYEVEVYSN